MAVLRGRELGTYGNEPGKPEDHRDHLHRGDDQVMRETGEEDRRKGEVGHGHKGGPAT